MILEYFLLLPLHQGLARTLQCSAVLRAHPPVSPASSFASPTTSRSILSSITRYPRQVFRTYASASASVYTDRPLIVLDGPPLSLSCNPKARSVLSPYPLLPFLPLPSFRPSVLPSFLPFFLPSFLPLPSFLTIRLPLPTKAPTITNLHTVPLDTQLLVPVHLPCSARD